MFKCLALIFFINLGVYVQADTVPNCDQICGKWLSSEKNLMVEVYKAGDHFKARIVWFNDDPSKPMGEWCDTKNPDPALRTRKILGMNVLSDLKYVAHSNSWEDGMIYDAKNGKEWNASAYINKQGLLKVKGYWHFKIFGRTMTFKRV
ncbi:MAG TPA: DUF2147 domain-containing protein [Mucilaginibacter sp.]|nr:DUF2147 domain-containing protein [Mucilaginibacter sp.]